MVKNTLKILQQDYKGVSDHFDTLCIKKLKAKNNVSRGSFFNTEF